MKVNTQQLLDRALSLPESERAELAASLINSLDPKCDEEADAAWAEEIQRRVESIDVGKVRLVPWDDVMQAMRDRRNG
ncbi:MAG: addiction module protein [Planctomycetaceae bacterium]